MRESCDYDDNCINEDYDDNYINDKEVASLIIHILKDKDLSMPEKLRLLRSKEVKMFLISKI